MINDKKDFWKRKLMAYLHDPPHKPYGIVKHEETIKSNLNIFALTCEDFVEFEHRSDAVAAAADRFCFPNPRKLFENHKLRTDWKSEGLPFIHPFCGSELKPHSHPVTRDVAEDWMSCALLRTIKDQDCSFNNFLKTWRLWERNITKEYGDSGLYMPYLVADTRIPDHTIWQHNSLVSALAGCGDKPAFMLFQIGPVQSFIAQAKKTQDLWAGSYILSYLNAIAMHVIATEYGPDHIVFPQIKGNPIIDKLFWNEYGEDLEFSEEAFLKWQKKQLLIPSLPNRFMALVSTGDREIIDKVKMEVRDSWKKIESAVHKFMKTRMDSSFPNWDELWSEQVDYFPRIDCMLHPFEDNDKIIEEFLEQKCPPFDNPEKHSTIQNQYWALDCIKDEYKDSRNYKNRYDNINNKYVMLGEDGKDLNQDSRAIINNLGFTWALQYLKAEWKFGALRNSRTFDQRFSFEKRAYQDKKRWVEKDPLDGINEVLGGQKNKNFWATVSKDDVLQKYFKGKQRYGAMSVIKRLFAPAYLKNEDVFDLNSTLRIKSIPEIASGRQIDSDNDLTNNDNKYYAVICLDGDNMGKWLSGENSQELSNQISGEGIKKFFNKNWDDNKGKLLRTVTPSYHLAFSEALSNFANYCVEPIIEKFKGQLIYAGGDDVMAMVPANNAIDCAEALQYAFRGIKPADVSTNTFNVLNDIFDYEWSEMELLSHTDGFLKLKKPGSSRPKHPMLMPGPRATVSAGIAIGHIKSPMQDTIKAARGAEQNAKDLGKDGFYLNIIKRSGESHGFFAHWNRKGEDQNWINDDQKKYSKFLSVWNIFIKDPTLEDSSNSLPYIYTQYISKLMKKMKGEYIEKFDINLIAACREFLRIVLERQTSLEKSEAEQRSKDFIRDLNLSNTTPENYLNFWKCYAFMKRIEKGGDE